MLSLSKFNNRVKSGQHKECNDYTEIDIVEPILAGKEGSWSQSVEPQQDLDEKVDGKDVVGYVEGCDGRQMVTIQESRC